MITHWFKGFGVPRAWFEGCLHTVFSRISDHLRASFQLAPDLGVDRDDWVARAQQASSPRWWCGWSMGGLQALMAAEADPSCQGLIIVAGTPCFVRQPDFSFGFEGAAIDDLQARWTQAPTKTLKRFFQMMLAGDPNARQHARDLQNLSADYSASQVSQLGEDLQWLAQVDFREKVKRFNKPIYFLLGEHDPLLPISESHALKALNPLVQIITLTEVGHAPFCSLQNKTDGNDFVAALEAILSEPTSSNVRAINGFDNAASNYAKVSGVQRAAARCLISAAPAQARTARRILDLGCGTGFLSQSWLNTHERHVETILGIDAAPNMLAQARTTANDKRLKFEEGTLEQPPSVVSESGNWDVLLSSFALHWAQSPLAVLEGWCAHVRPGGWLGIALPVQGSFAALTQAWATVDAYQHVVDLPAWGNLLDDLITRLGANNFDAWQQVFYTEHDDLAAMKKSLKQLGAAGLQQNSRRGLLTPRQFRSLETALHGLASSRGRLPLDYTVGFVWLQKPV